MIQSTETLGSYFLSAAERHPDKVFLERPGRKITYREALIRVAGTAIQLKHRGLKRGDYVACYLEEQVPALFFNLTCALTGIIPAPLSPIFTVDYFVNGLVDVLGADTVFSTLRHAPALVKAGIHPLCYAD